MQAHYPTAPASTLRQIRHNLFGCCRQRTGLAGWNSRAMCKCITKASTNTNRPGWVLQAEDRAHRLGQQGCVQVRYLIAPGSIDDAMWPLLGRKLQVVGRTLDGDATGSATGKAYPYSC